MVKLSVSSSDGGQTLTGTVTYEDEGPVDFRASRSNPDNKYEVEFHSGGDSDAAWNYDGTWVMGYETESEPILSVDLYQDDDIIRDMKGSIAFKGGASCSVSAVIE